MFLSDVLFDREKTGGKTIPIPFGKTGCTVFRIALQMLGDLTGFGISYFDFDNTGM